MVETKRRFAPPGRSPHNPAHALARVLGLFRLAAFGLAPRLSWVSTTPYELSSRGNYPMLAGMPLREDELG